MMSVFKSKKLKLTPQRIAVYETLKNTKSHPSAEVVYESIHDRFPTMSLATVYKALKTLVDVGLVQELNVGEGIFRYDANSAPHPHIVCMNCGRVDDIDVDGSFFLSLNDSMKNHTDYQILSSRIYFYGICPHCK